MLQDLGILFSGECFLFRKRFSFGKFEVGGRKFESQLLSSSIFSVALDKKMGKQRGLHVFSFSSHK